MSGAIKSHSRRVEPGIGTGDDNKRNIHVSISLTSCIAIDDVCSDVCPLNIVHILSLLWKQNKTIQRKRNMKMVKENMLIGFWGRTEIAFDEETPYNQLQISTVKNIHYIDQHISGWNNHIAVEHIIFEYPMWILIKNFAIKFSENQRYTNKF